MLTLEKRVEDDSSTVLGDPHAEFDILDAGACETLVESPNVMKLGRSHGAAAGPKRAGPSRVADVRVVVKQVAILTDDSRGSRGGIVGAEYGHRSVHRGERLVHALDCVGRQLHVGVDEKQDSANGLLSPPVPGSRRSARHSPSQHPHALPAQPCRWLGHRAIVHDDEFDGAWR